MKIQVRQADIPQHLRRFFRPVGHKPKDLIDIPHMVAEALRADGWYLRQAVTWCKTAPMPESVSDRPTSATEMVFLLTRSARYFYDQDATRVPLADDRAYLQWEQRKALGDGSGSREINRWSSERTAAPNGVGANPAGRNLWNYWVLPPEQFSGAHYAVMPQKLAEPCILAGTSEAGCCRVCGSPWERVVERERVWTAKDHGTTNKVHHVTPQGPARTGNARAGNVESITTGWRPTCTHAGEPWPCLVLDPFLGSGTTAVVAERLGRRWVGIELDERSAQIARDRTAQLGFGRLLAAGGASA